MIETNVSVASKKSPCRLMTSLAKEKRMNMSASYIWTTVLYFTCTKLFIKHIKLDRMWTFSFISDKRTRKKILFFHLFTFSFIYKDKKKVFLI